MLKKEELIKLIDEKYPLENKEIGTMAFAKVSPMKFVITQCYAKGLGNVSFMSAKGMFGLMKMEALIINPFEIDAPLFSYDYISALGNITLLIENYETRLVKGNYGSKLEKVQKEYSFLADAPVESRWYDSILLPVSMFKKGKKKQETAFDEATKKYLREYLNECADLNICDTEEKRKSAQYYTEGLLKNGGPSTDMFIKKMGMNYTKKLFREVLFATGTPEEGD